MKKRLGIYILIGITILIIIGAFYFIFFKEKTSETELLCSQANLKLEKVCWDNNNILLIAENKGNISISRIKAEIFGGKSSGEVLTEKQINIGDSKTYTINYEKEKLGEITNIKISFYITQNNKPVVCNEIDKRANDCATPEQPNPILPNVTSNETLKINLNERGGGGGGGGPSSPSPPSEPDKCKGITCDDGYVCGNGNCAVNENICLLAEQNEICDGLDIAYAEGYKNECYSKYGKC